MDGNRGTNRGRGEDHDCVQNGEEERRVLPQQRRKDATCERCHRLKTKSLLNFVVEGAKLSIYLGLSKPSDY